MLSNGLVVFLYPTSSARDSLVNSQPTRFLRARTWLCADSAQHSLWWVERKIRLWKENKKQIGVSRFRWPRGAVDVVFFRSLSIRTGRWEGCAGRQRERGWSSTLRFCSAALIRPPLHTSHLLLSFLLSPDALSPPGVTDSANYLPEGIFLPSRVHTEGRVLLYCVKAQDFTIKLQLKLYFQITLYQTCFNTFATFLTCFAALSFYLPFC